MSGAREGRHAASAAQQAVHRCAHNTKHPHKAVASGTQCVALFVCQGQLLQVDTQVADNGTSQAEENRNQPRVLGNVAVLGMRTGAVAFSHDCTVVRDGCRGLAQEKRVDNRRRQSKQREGSRASRSSLQPLNKAANKSCTSRGSSPHVGEAGSVLVR